ncbi:MAG: L-tyrosine/L-tryptophan isonitrile synthase family protein [Symploca sp. SIO3C6]|nr:L-tyrosine/L-tryptophan isonitrile synthase family protein [Symploca sp. SIO3C6]
MTRVIDRAKSKMIGEQILNHLFCYRRLWSETDPCAQEPCSSCLVPHLQKIESFIEQEKPIHFVLPAFPAKSPNKTKVLGSLPDMGEKISLQFLQSLCVQIQDFYAPGAQITICSDGRVFSDLVCVNDEDVTAYGKELKNILDDIGADAINIFNLEGIFAGLSCDDIRQKLVLNYADSLETIRCRVKNDPNERNLFNGIHRFLFEDYLFLQPSKSRNRLRNESKKSAYGVIQRSHAWSDLIAEQFPHTIRLSIHPQPVHSEKIGIHMIKTQDAWATPWHNVAVYDGKQFLLMKRSEAESMGASLVWCNNRPSHFILSDTPNSPLQE